MTKGERLVLISVVAVNIMIYLVVITLAWQALPRLASVEEIVVGYFPTETPVAVAKAAAVLPTDPFDASSATFSSSPTPTLPPSALACPPPPGWGAYFVRRGDTLFSLARAHHLSVDEAKSANCLESDLLQVDQILFLPLPTPTPTPPPWAWLARGLRSTAGASLSSRQRAWSR